MRRRFALLALVFPLAACMPGPPPPASQYRAAATTTPLPLVFAPGTTDLGPAELAQLHQLGQTLPVQVVPILQTGDPLGFWRAQAVGRALGRPVQFLSVPALPPDQALLVMSGPAIVADACRGRGQRELGSIWPGNDDAAPLLLPPGCATQLDIEAQTVRPADLLQGQPLPPGAATPFAAAIERYYHRNDPAQSNAAQQGGSQAGTDQSEATTTTSGAAPAVLTGPLPSGGQPAQ